MTELPTLLPDRGRWAVAAGAGSRAGSLDLRATTRALKVIVLSVVLLQRFAVPGLDVALCAPIVLAVTGYLLLEGALVRDTRNTEGYLVAVACCCVAATLSTTFFGAHPSLTSLALLVVLYVPFCFRLRAAAAQLLPALLEFFNQIMAVLAVVAIVEWAAQFAGRQLTDPFAKLPRALLVQGFNTSYPIHYGSRILKANAVVFLEPSFCSQFLALAIIVQLLIGGRRWRLPLYGVALATTLSGTGLLLLGVGLAVLAFRRGGHWAAQVATVVAALGVVVALSPLGALVTGRTTEATRADTSGNARFVAPYTQVAHAFRHDLAATLVGRGPGAVSRAAATALFDPTRALANYPAVPKLAAEYGLVAALVFTWFVLRAITAGTPSPTLAVCLLLLYFVLSGSLLQPATTYTCLVLGVFFAGRHRTGPEPGGGLRW